jgi:hypothetical protein
MLGEIDADLNERQDLYTAMAFFRNKICQPTTQVLVGLAQCHIATRPDDIHDCLCLGQVDSSVDESSAGELPWLRQSGTLIHQDLKGSCRQKTPTMQAKLNYVLRSI